jgi:hypothetical protein
MYLSKVNSRIFSCKNFKPKRNNEQSWKAPKCVMDPNCICIVKLTAIIITLLYNDTSHIKYTALAKWNFLFKSNLPLIYGIKCLLNWCFMNYLKHEVNEVKKIHIPLKTFCLVISPSLLPWCQLQTKKWKNRGKPTQITRKLGKTGIKIWSIPEKGASTS